MKKKSKRAQACDTSFGMRQKLRLRDKCCINCFTTNHLTVAHYVSRAQGGLGIPENLVTLCVACHRAYDQGKDRAEAEKIDEKVREYLQILYPDFTDKQRGYR